MQMSEGLVCDQEFWCINHDFGMKDNTRNNQNKTNFCKFCGIAKIWFSNQSKSEVLIRSQNYNFSYELMDTHFDILNSLMLRHKSTSKNSSLKLSPGIKKNILNTINQRIERVGWDRSLLFKAMVILDLTVSRDQSFLDDIAQTIDLSLIIASKINSYSRTSIQLQDFFNTIYEQNLYEMPLYNKTRFLENIIEIYKYKELKMSEVLEWNFNPVTPYDFLKLFMQTGTFSKKELSTQILPIINHHYRLGILPENDFPNIKKYISQTISPNSRFTFGQNVEQLINSICKIFAEGFALVADEIMFNSLLFDEFYNCNPLHFPLSTIQIAHNLLGLKKSSLSLEHLSNTNFSEFKSLKKNIQSKSTQSIQYRKHYETILRNAFANLDDYLSELENAIKIQLEQQSQNHLLYVTQLSNRSISLRCQKDEIVQTRVQVKKSETDNFGYTKTELKLSIITTPIEENNENQVKNDTPIKLRNEFPFDTQEYFDTKKTPLTFLTQLPSCSNNSNQPFTDTIPIQNNDNQNVFYYHEFFEAADNKDSSSQMDQSFENYQRENYFERNENLGGVMESHEIPKQAPRQKKIKKQKNNAKKIRDSENSISQSQTKKNLYLQKTNFKKI